MFHVIVFGVGEDTNVLRSEVAALYVCVCARARTLSMLYHVTEVSFELLYV